MFNAEKAKVGLINWLRENIPVRYNAVIGISGGKDSAIVAALCAEAIGEDNVIGVMLPNNFQKDINVARNLIDFLGIKSLEFNISEIFNSFLETTCISSNHQIETNLPSRIRMDILRMVASSYNGIIINTNNLSEDYIGWCTKGVAGDLSPLAELTVAEIIQIGDLLLPKEFVHKTPEDGLSGKSDEDNFGFSYEVLDKYIRTKEIEDSRIKKLIDKMHDKSRHKFYIPSYKYTF